MIIGHQKKQDELRLLFEKDNIPHALLFTGPEKIGKRTIALWFLKMINCKSDNSPCLECCNCTEIDKGIYSDIWQVFPEEKEICHHQIEEIIEKVSFKGTKGKFKGVIVDNAHLMNFQSQNTILKTLEEPPPRTIIILISEHPQTILSTIISRSFIVNFNFVSDKDINNAINNSEVTKLSLGRPGIAIDYINFPEKRQKMIATENEVQEIFNNNIVDRFSLIKKIEEEGRSDEFLRHLLKAIQDKMIAKIDKKEDTKKYRESIKEIEETIFLHSKTNMSIRLALEKIIIKI